ncbi:hypothetical protein J6590_006545 [Homalodisca vitripennis]|nr:hypothetical protein J6590_006545 [Homalodisca vitripennis]
MKRKTEFSKGQERQTPKTSTLKADQGGNSSHPVHRKLKRSVNNFKEKGKGGGDMCSAPKPTSFETLSLVIYI